MPSTVYLVDASPYIFRAYFSLPSSIRDPEGRRAGATLGFAGFMLRLLTSESPSHLAMCFDGNLSGSFRNQVYPDYKAHREPPPPELEAQIPDCIEMARALGVATFIDDEFEADDLIATLAAPLIATDWEAVVVTSDKDLCQLVSERVTLLDFARELRMGPREVEEKLGVRPEQVTDFLALAGDSVDNIPGVRGVGAKSAVRLLERWDHLEDLLGDLDQIETLDIRGAASLRRKLEAGRESARMSKWLATLSSEAPVEATPEALRWNGPSMERVESLSARLGFARLPGRVASQLG